MAVDRAEVEHIARLARLSLTDEEIDRFTGQLNSILGHMDRLAELDAEAAEAEAQAGPEAGTPLRAEDVPTDVLRFAPEDLSAHWRHGFFTVPRLAAQERMAEGGDATELEADDDA